MIKLYGGPRTRAGITQWYLEELGVSYESVIVGLQAGAQHKPEYRAINPFGKVPTLDDDGTKVWESGATLLYLADKYGNMPKTPEGRSAIYAWVLYANATLTPAVLDEKNRVEHVKRVVEPLNGILSNTQFLVGQELTVADVAVCAILAWSATMLKVDFSPYPAVLAYMGRLAQRPAFQRALGGLPT
jgi:glutathione S-transferase